MLLIKQNLLAAFLVVTTSLFVYFLGHKPGFSLAHLLYLPLGAALYSYLCLSPKTIFSVLLVNTMVGYFLFDNWHGNGVLGFYAHTVVGSVSPLLAILLVKFFQLENFYENFYENFKHGPYLLLAAMAASINTLAKFFIIHGNIDIAPEVSIGVFLIGDFLGAAIFLFLFAPQINKFTLKYNLRQCWLSKF